MEGNEISVVPEESVSRVFARRSSSETRLRLTLMKNPFYFYNVTRQKGTGRITFVPRALYRTLPRRWQNNFQKCRFLCTCRNNRQFRRSAALLAGTISTPYTECAAISQPLSAPGAAERACPLRQPRLTRVIYSESFIRLRACFLLAHFSPSIFGPTARHSSAPPNTTRLPAICKPFRSVSPWNGPLFLSPCSFMASMASTSGCAENPTSPRTRGSRIGFTPRSVIPG